MLRAMHDLARFVVDVPDFPQPGILFRDISTLLREHLSATVSALDGLFSAAEWAGFDAVAGIESRGFVLAAALATLHGKGFVPVRKKGKLPHETVSVTYQLEYGTDEIEVHKDAVKRGERVLLVDDLIATGGTAEGAVSLLSSLGAEVVAACFIVDLPDLGGADKVRRLGVPVRTLVSFSGH